MLIVQLFEPSRATYSYLIADLTAGAAALIDPVPQRLEDDARLLRSQRLDLFYVLETSVRPDDASSAFALRALYGSKVVRPNAHRDLWGDVLVGEYDALVLGKYRINVTGAPSSSPDCVAYVVVDEGVAFTGDMLALRGEANDPSDEGAARRLYRNVHDRLFRLPEDTLVYPSRLRPGGLSVSTIGAERARDFTLRDAVTEDEYVALVKEAQAASAGGTLQPAPGHRGLAASTAVGRPRMGSLALLHPPIP